MKITRRQLRQIIKEEFTIQRANRLAGEIERDHKQELSSVLRSLEALKFHERIQSLADTVEVIGRDTSDSSVNPWGYKYSDDKLNKMVTITLVTHLLGMVIDQGLQYSDISKKLTNLASNNQTLEKFIREIELGSTSDSVTGEYLQDQERYESASNVLLQALLDA